MLLMQDTQLQYYLLYLLTCALGLTYSPFIFSLTLVDIVVRSPLLQKVIDSVSVNKKALGLTFFFIGIVIYFFTLLGQLYFRDDYMFKLSNPTNNHTHADLCSNTQRVVLRSFRKASENRTFDT